MTNKVLEIMKKRGLKDQFIERRTQKITLFILSAHLARPSLGIKFDINQLLKILLSLEKEAMIERQLDENAYSYLINQVISNEKRFNHRNEKSGTNKSALLNPTWGTIAILKNGEKEVEIPKERFEELMKLGGYESSKTIISAWKNKGLLNYEKDRTTRKRKLGYPNLTNVYVIKYSETSEEISEASSSE